MSEDPFEELRPIIRDIKKKFILEIVNDFKGMKYELGTDYFDSYILKWEEKVK